MSDSVYRNETFIKYKFQWDFSFPNILALIPMIYIIPTIFIIFRIFHIYLRSLMNKKTSLDMDMNIFSIIVCSHFMNLLFFISDFLMYRLPATGMLTSWCASTPNSFLLTAIVFFTYYSAYTILIFPSLLSFIRLFLIISPYSKLTTTIFRVSLPSIFIYPLFFTFFLIPATGLCKPLEYPYPFGSLMIYYKGSYNNIHNSPFFLANNVVWMIIGGGLNIILLMKLTSFNFQIKNQSPSNRSYKSRSAEYSITITTISMLLSALINCIFVVSYLQLPVYIDYITIGKCIGSDCETVISPWIFYLTHPIFNRKKKIESVKIEVKSTVFVRIA